MASDGTNQDDGLRGESILHDAGISRASHPPLVRPPSNNGTPQQGREITSPSAVNGGGSALYAGAFFPSSQKLLVTGGVFTSNVTNNIHEGTTLPSDFRMIPLGDIDLRREIKLNWRTGVVERQRRCIRNVYSARICGLSDMTVALYQGAGSEEEWLEDISKVSWLRHPSFVQIYGAASSGGIHAAIFHGDLIPLRQVHDLYCHSHFATVCFWVSSNYQFAAAALHFKLLSQTWVFEGDYGTWIRRSTGQLSVDVMLSGPRDFAHSRYLRIPAIDDLLTLDDVNQETIIIDNLTLEHYHEICTSRLARAHL